jgi:hypothetical protein
MRAQTSDDPEPYRNKAFDKLVYKELVLDKEKERKRKKDSQ